MHKAIRRVAHATRQLRKRMARERVRRKRGLTWWLIYGPPRAGTTYMHRLLETCDVLHVSDWGLDSILSPIPAWLQYYSAAEFDYIRFDRDRLLHDISRNILDNAYMGNGVQLDLVYKQATLGPSEYEALVQMWGEPERAIFCLREPAGYIASARKKFVYGSLERLQQIYVDSITSYLHIGGDLFEYRPDLTVSDYTSFLQPLSFEGKRLPTFEFRGVQEPENTTDIMWNCYQEIKALAAGQLAVTGPR